MRIISDAGVFAATGSPVYTTHMASSQLSVGTYSIPRGGADDQSPHAEDEIYVVTSGQAGFEGPWGRVSVGPGAVLFVPAGEAHRFVDVTEDLALLVIFAPPYSGEDLSSGCLGWRVAGGGPGGAEQPSAASRRPHPSHSHQSPRRRDPPAATMRRFAASRRVWRRIRMVVLREAGILRVIQPLRHPGSGTRTRYDPAPQR